MFFLSCWDGSKATLCTKLVVCWSLTSLQSTLVGCRPNMPKWAKVWRSPVSGAVLEVCRKPELRHNHLLINAWSRRILDLTERQSIIKAQHLSLPSQHMPSSCSPLSLFSALPWEKRVLIKERHNSLSSHLNSLYEPSQQTQTLSEKVFHVGNSGFFFFLKRAVCQRVSNISFCRQQFFYTELSWQLSSWDNHNLHSSGTKLLLTV